MSEESHDQTVPLERFNKINQKLKDTLSELAAITEQRDNFQREAKSAELYKTQRDELRAELGKANQRYDTHTAIAKHGIVDPDVRDGIEFAFSRLSEDQQKAGLSSVLEQWVGDPSQAPSLLRPHFEGLGPQSTTKQTGAETSEQPTSRPKPSDPHRGVVPTPDPPQGEPSAADIASMSHDQFVSYMNSQREASGLPKVG